MLIADRIVLKQKDKIYLFNINNVENVQFLKPFFVFGFNPLKERHDRLH